MNCENMKKMSNSQRQKVVKLAKKDVIWNQLPEQKQDELIEKVCSELGFNYIQFWATDGHYLDTLLK